MLSIFKAAILDCYVITSKRGSVTFFEDVTIPAEYKFEDKKGNISKISGNMKIAGVYSNSNI